ncbi:MAG: RDD family protein [Candidatus Omnitrophica bacterium]|nr:RDD family protein [Candidatus Omnitrophota bacterium]
MKSQNLTIMFTDMKDFSAKTSAQSREATVDMIRRHKELLVPVIEGRGGKLIKSIGDAFLVTFESPTDAVLAGMALQSVLHEFNEKNPTPSRIEVRVAINTGEVSLDEGDVYGEAVNIASRIQGLAEPNEIYFTESTFLSMNKSEVPSAEIGYRILKGIPQKIKIYKVLKEGELPETVMAAGLAGGGFPNELASYGKRMAAFGIDIILAGCLAAFLMNGEYREWKQLKNEIGGPARSTQRFDRLKRGGPSGFEGIQQELQGFERQKQMKQRELDRALEDLARMEQQSQEMGQGGGRVGDLEKRHQEAERMLEQDRREIEQKRQELEELERGAQEMSRDGGGQHEVRRLEDEISDLQSEIKDLQRELIQYIAKPVRARELRSEISDKQDELEEKRNELRTVQREVVPQADSMRGGAQEVERKRRELEMMEERYQRREEQTQRMMEDAERQSAGGDQTRRVEEEIMRRSEDVMRLEKELREIEGIQTERRDEVTRMSQEVQEMKVDLIQGRKHILFKFFIFWTAAFLIMNIVLLGWKGRTAGKALWKLKVCGMSGEPIGWGRAILRTLFYIISLMPLGLGFLWSFADPYRQTWHDKMTNTYVVSEI